MAALYSGFVDANPVCVDPTGFDLVTSKPLKFQGYGLEQTSGAPVYVISEPEAIRLASLGVFSPISNEKSRNRAGLVGASLSDDGVVGLFGDAQLQYWVNKPAVFVVALDPVTDGSGYFEFKNYYSFTAQVDGLVQADWIIQQPLIARRYTSGRPDCGCSTDTGIECGEGQPGPGGGGCLPDVGCVDFPHDQVSLGDLPGPQLQSIPNSCTGGTNYVDTFGNQVRGMLGFEQWYDRALGQNFMGPIGGGFGLCEICKKVLPEACGDSPYTPPITLPPPVPECGSIPQAVDRICQVSLVDPASGFCAFTPNVPHNLGPYCVDGSATGALMTGAPGVVQIYPGDLRACQVPASELCKRMEPGALEYCEPAAETERVSFWLNLLACGLGNAPGSEFECLGTKGVCQTQDGIKFCSYCSGERCTQWVERGIGDPRRFQSGETGCDATGCSEASFTFTIPILMLEVQFGGGSLISFAIAPKPEEEVEPNTPQPSEAVPDPKLQGNGDATNAAQAANTEIVNPKEKGKKPEEPTKKADPSSCRPANSLWIPWIFL